jgi:hypothetical protein
MASRSQICRSGIVYGKSCEPVAGPVCGTPLNAGVGKWLGCRQTRLHTLRAIIRAMDRYNRRRARPVADVVGPRPDATHRSE